MKITATKNKNIWVLGIAFGLLFFGWNAAEQHLTAFYQTEGAANVAFNALTILYGSIVIGNFIGPTVAHKVGLKNALVFGFATYIALVFGTITRLTILIYALSSLLGIGCGIMSVAQVDLLRILSPEERRGEITGFVNSLRALGAFLGVLGTSLLLRRISISNVYLLLGIVMTFGVVTIALFLTPQKQEVKESEPVAQLIKNTLVMIKDGRVLLLVPAGVANGFLLGLVLGKIPTMIEKVYGIENVGIITALFHITLSFSGFLGGKLSDRKGRFPTLYGAAMLGVTSALIILSTHQMVPLILAMILAGIFSATNGVVFGALNMDLFGRRVKEASAAGGIVMNLIGVVPAFVLGKFLSETNLLYIAISTCILGLIFLRILELRMRKMAIQKV